MHDQLISDSEQGLSLLESPALRTATTAQWTEEDVQAALEFIQSNADFKSYHLLFALSEMSRAKFSSIPARTKASILVSALERLRSLSDWGYLDLSECYDGRAAKALLATGPTAIPLLTPVLDNKRSAPLFGSEDVKLSSLYTYRRCDFAYRYAGLIQRKIIIFRPDPIERDADIANMKQDLVAKVAEKPNVYLQLETAKPKISLPAVSLRSSYSSGRAGVVLNRR